MALKKFKPTSPGRRFMTVSGFEEVTKSKPEKSLTGSVKKTGGRNNKGRITTRHKGGGHKRRYREIDFKRTKDGVPGEGRGDRVRPEPLGEHRPAPLRGRREGVHPRPGAPEGRRDGRVRARTPTSSPGTRCRSRTSRPGRSCTTSSSSPAGAARWRGARASGIQLVAKDEGYGVLRLPSGELRRVALTCRATIGQVGNIDHENISGGKAGRSRWRGKRPTVRGSAMNPVDHPHGGGEGKSKGGRHPVTPWGVPTLGKRTRSKHKDSDRLIVRGRRRGKDKR